ncbi:MAG: Omp28-related outer membrane protein [Paludibacteraceae bacterium]|nr:Omp28-related outer membrane protein [Paludibacteraceae bacterium]
MVKRLSYIFIALLMCSCELIKEEDRLIPLPQPEKSSARTHVLIEYTGFLCVNCPTASEIAQDLQQLYDSQLIVVAMHPASSPFTQGAAQFDYTCPAADTYFTLCGGNAQTAFPKGNIDLLPLDNNYLLDPSLWSAQMLRLSKDSTTVSIDLTATIDTLTRQVNISSTLHADSTKQLTVMYWLVEDSVLGAQRMPDGSNNMQYYHRHMLRAEYTSAPPFTLPANYTASHCTLVAVVQDSTHRILQAKQTSLKPL